MILSGWHEAELYVSGYTEASLAVWAAKVQAWAVGRPPREPG